MPLPSKPINVGDQFDRFTVVMPISTRSSRGERQFACRCKCGAERVVTASRLLGGAVKSCGCYKRDHPGRLRHGHTIGRAHTVRATAEYRAWSGILQRCGNPNNAAYQNYGGRGIAVCEQWRDSFDAFYRDMGPRPSPAHTVDRIDNDGNYEAGNCRWATRTQQNRNRRDNQYLTYNGETLLRLEWAARIGVHPDVLRDRLGKLGWSVEKALHYPASKVAPTSR